METNLDIPVLYIIFVLDGETAIILGFCNPMISIIFEHKRLVAVNTKQCAPSGIMLRTSLIPDRVERNVVPLKLYKWIILAIHFSIIY